MCPQPVAVRRETHPGTEASLSEPILDCRRRVTRHSRAPREDVTALFSRSAHGSRLRTEMTTGVPQQTTLRQKPAIYFANTEQKALCGPVTCKEGYSDYPLPGAAPLKTERGFA